MTVRSDIEVMNAKAPPFTGLRRFCRFWKPATLWMGTASGLFKNIYGFSACCGIGSDMAETTDNLVLEHLRAIRADISALNGNMRDVKARLSSIESYIATLHGDQTRAGLTLDDLAARIERLEKRAGLIEA